MQLVILPSVSELFLISWVLRQSQTLLLAWQRWRFVAVVSSETVERDGAAAPRGGFQSLRPILSALGLLLLLLHLQHGPVWGTSDCRPTPEPSQRCVVSKHGTGRLKLPLSGHSADAYNAA